MSEIIKPYRNSKSGKKQQVADMFNNISHRYDFLNHLLSLGIDKIWRRKAVSLLKKNQPKKILDVATGTADFAIESMSLKPDKIIGVDISKGMLEIGKKKIRKKGMNSVIQLLYGDSENLPFDDASFDAVIVGFGVRNFENLDNGLLEIKRVLRPKGNLLILEFSKPKRFPIKQCFSFYSKYIIPAFGKSFSKDSAAYSYLPASVNAFPEGLHFVSILEQIGFEQVEIKLLSGGIASIYYGINR